MTSFFALNGANFLFSRVIKFLVILDLPHSQKLVVKKVLYWPLKVIHSVVLEINKLPLGTF